MFLYLSTTDSINDYLLCIYFVADTLLNAETEPCRPDPVPGVYLAVCSTEKLKEIPLGSSELRAVLNQVTLCELPPTDPFCKNKNMLTSRMLTNEIDI